MRAFTRIAAVTMLAGGLTVSGTGAALANPADEGLLGHVLTGLLGEGLPQPAAEAGAGPASAGEAPASTTAPGGTLP